MDNILEATVDYDFSKLYLGPPTTVPGGAYFTKIMQNTNKPLYIQTPKSLTKQGFVKSGKKVYTDLMFDNNDTVFINWIENLESTCQELIFSKGQTWFETKLEKDDIESAFTSPFKIFKSGKYYLLRINVKPNIKVYNETEHIINIEDVSCEKNIISILEIQGIRFTSKNFQIEFELKQAMLVSPDPFLDECFIKKPNRKPIVKEAETKGLQTKDIPTNDIPTNDLPTNDLPTNDLTEEKDLTTNDIQTNDIQTNDIQTKDIPTKDLTEETKDLTEETDLEEFDINTFINESATDLVKNEKQNDLAVSFDLPNNTNNNVHLEITELEDPNILKEVDLSLSLEKNTEPITLKKPNQVYYEIYEKARDKAKEAKKNALQAYLEMKNIKKTYMLDDIDESDSDLEMDNSSDEEDLDDSY